MYKNIISKHKSAIYSILSVFLRVFTGPVSILLISDIFTIKEQAVYYVFLSIASIQWIFELGLSTCLIQKIASTDDENSKASLIKFGFLFFSLSSILLFITMQVYAHWTFSELSSDLWLGPWVFYSVAVSINVVFNIFLIVEEANGSPEYLYFTRFLGGLLYSVTLIVTIYMGFGLYSLFLSQISLLFVYFFRLKRNSENILFSIMKIDIKKVFIEVKSILPFQFKLSLVWISGYLYWNLYSIYLLKFSTIELSAQFGATNAIISALSFASISILQTKRTNVSRKIKNGENTLDVFFESILLASLFYILSCFFIYNIITYEVIINNERFLSGVMLISYVVLRFFSMMIEMNFIYVRCYNDEPFYKITMVFYSITPLLLFLPVNIEHVFIAPLLTIFCMSLFYFCKTLKYVKHYDQSKKI